MPAFTLAVLTIAALLGGIFSHEDGRQLLRKLKYEIILGQPLINGVPRMPVPCASLRGPTTLVVLAFGQSNSANFGAGRLQPKAGVYNFFEGRCYRANDPMPGADGGGGSVWSRLGDRIVDEGLASKVVFATIGVGGSEIARWKSEGDLNGRLLSTVAAMQAAGLPPNRLLWHQGEADRMLGTSAAAYRAAFLDMLGSLRRHGVTVPIHVAVATYCNGQYNPALQQAQRALVDEPGMIYPGPDTDSIRGDLLRSDDCHFSAQGLARHAEAWLSSLRERPR